MPYTGAKYIYIQVACHRFLEESNAPENISIPDTMA
jgi:hypothetical protein